MSFSWWSNYTSWYLVTVQPFYQKPLYKPPQFDYMNSSSTSIAYKYISYVSSQISEKENYKPLRKIQNGNIEPIVFIFISNIYIFCAIYQHFYVWEKLYSLLSQTVHIFFIKKCIVFVYKNMCKLFDSKIYMFLFLKK